MNFELPIEGRSADVGQADDFSCGSWNCQLRVVNAAIRWSRPNADVSLVLSIHNSQFTISAFASVADQFVQVLPADDAGLKAVAVGAAPVRLEADRSGVPVALERGNLSPPVDVHLP